MNFGGERGDDTEISVALKCGLGVAVFNLALPLLTTLLPRYRCVIYHNLFISGKLDTQTFASLWKQQQANEAYFDLQVPLDVETINNRLQENNIFYVTKADKEGSVC